MNLNEGPVIEICDKILQSRFSPRMIHSGIGPGMYPLEHLRSMVHMGIDAVILETGNAENSDEKQKTINDLVALASSVGLDVYTYSHFKNLYHPDDPEAKAYYASTYGKLFARCPGVKGIIFVGESCEFPSHDERTTGKDWKESIGMQKPSPGWFPCRDYPDFIACVRDAIRAEKPDADLVFCYGNKLGWDPAAVLQPLGARAQTFDDVERMVAAITAAARPGDHVLIMSNGGFGGAHSKLLDALARADEPSAARCEACGG
jgi:hypothetical protein